MNKQPLVSILVVTFNSSSFVKDTLDSAFYQDYENIELVISDDGSSDKTIQIVKEWIVGHKYRFVKCCVVESPGNTGIPANVNRGLAASSGEWIKCIAGDDILLPKCISVLMSQRDGSSEAIIGGIKNFYLNEKGEKCYGQMWPMRSKRYVFHKPSEFQYKYFLTVSMNIAPGAIFKKSLFNRIGAYDEKFPMIEDLPFWIKITKNGVKVDYINIPCVQYRTQHESSVFAQTKIYNQHFMDCYFDCHKQIIEKEVSWLHIPYWESLFIEKFLYFVAITCFKNKPNKVYNVIKKIVVLISAVA